MACLRPLPATQDAEGIVSLRQSRLEATLEDGEYLELSCGTCDSCRAKRVRSWAIRSHHEAQMHTRPVGSSVVQNGCFITLTYDDDHLPSDGSLDVEHWKNFAKKIRRDRGKFRFLHCGEYGSLNQRPHYHACIFGLDFHEDRQVWKTDGKSVTWLSAELTAIWGKGFTTVAPLNYATAAYTAGYVMKKLKNQAHREQHAVYGASHKPIEMIKPEYVTMSRNPGLGTTWFEKFWPEIYPADQVNIGGKTFKPPAFYDRLLLETHPCLYDEVMANRKKYLDELGPTSDNALRARGENFAARYALKKPRM